MIRLKNEDEIAGIRKACHLTADMFNELLPKVKEGMSTYDVDIMFKNYIESHGGKPAWYRNGFPGAVCISVNDEVIHGLPSKKRIIRKGDLVSIDAGIDLDGYISDSTHSVLIGEVDPKVKKLKEVTEECLKAGIAACKVGNRIKDISNAIAKKYRESNVFVGTASDIDSFRKYFKIKSIMCHNSGIHKISR